MVNTYSLLTAISVLLIQTVFVLPVTKSLSDSSSPIQPYTLSPVLTFEENRGQFQEDIRFASRNNGFRTFFTIQGAQIQAGGFPLEIGIQNAVQNTPVGLETLVTRSNYFLGNNPSKWLVGVRHYGKIKYPSVLPGIDLEFYGAGSQLEFDLILAPGVDPEAIILQFTPELAWEHHGDELQAPIPTGHLSLKKPIAYQSETFDQQPLEILYTLDHQGNVRFKIDHPIDLSKQLVIDPIIEFSASLGGDAEDSLSDMAVDSEKNIILTGTTESFDFPEANPLFNQPMSGGLYQSNNRALSWSLSNLRENVTSVAIHPKNGSIIYAGTHSKGVYKSVNGGKNWTRLQNSPMVFKIKDISLHPTNPQILYVVGDYPYKTTDGGKSWSKIEDMGYNVYKTSIDPSNSGIIYASTYNGPYRSNNGGSSWKKIDNGLPSRMSFLPIVSPTTPSTLYCYKFKVLYKSTNRGNSWKSIYEFEKSLYTIAVDPNNGMHLFASDSEGFYESIDGGQSFQILKSRIGLYPDKAPILIDPINPKKLYGIDFTRIVKSDDGGMNWHLAEQGTPGTSPQVFALFPTTPNRLFAAYGSSKDIFISKLDPTGSTLLFSTYLGGSAVDTAERLSLTSANNILVVGQTYSSDFPRHGAIRDEFSGSTEAFVTQINSKGNKVLYSSFLGGSAAEKATNIEIKSGKAYIVGGTTSQDFPQTANLPGNAGGGVFQTLNSGQNWQHQNGQLAKIDAKRIIFDPNVAGIIYIVAENGLFQSINDGKNWQNLGFSNTSEIQDFAVHPKNSALLFLTNQEGLFKSTNRGKNWSKINNCPQLYGAGSIGLHPTKTSHILIAAGGKFVSTGKMQPLLYETLNGGVTWRLLEGIPLPSVNSVQLDPKNPAYIYLMGSYNLSGYFTAKSADGGQTWTIFGRKGVQGVISIDPNNPSILFQGVTPEGKIYRSQDRGITWKRTSQGLQDSETGFTNITVTPGNSNIVYATTHYFGIFKSLNGGDTWQSTNTGLHSLYGSGFAVDPRNTKRLLAAMKNQSTCFITVFPLNNPGSFQSVLLGGLLNDGATSVAVDTAGKILIGGSTRSSNWPLKNPIQTFEGSYLVPQGFMTKINPSLDGLIYSTHIGKAGAGVKEIRLNPAGDAIVIGYPFKNFPLVDPIQTDGDGYLIRVNSAGKLLFSTYLTHRSDRLAFDRNNAMVVVGENSLTKISPSFDKIAYQEELDGEIEAVATSEDGGVFIAGDGTIESPEFHELSEHGGVFLAKIRESSRTDYLPFLRESTTEFTGYALSNYSGKKSWSQLYGHSLTGSFLYSFNNPADVRLNPHQQSARLGREIFDFYPTNKEGWVRIFTNNPETASFFQFGGATSLDGSIAQNQSSKKIVFTRIYEGHGSIMGHSAHTTFYLANPGKTFTYLNITFHEKTTKNREITKERIWIASHGCLKLTIPGLFGITQVSGGYLEVTVTSGPGVVGFQLIELPECGTVIGLNGQVDNPGKRSYSAQLANGSPVENSGFFTNLSLVNTSSEKRNLKLSAIRQDGTLMVPQKNLSLQPGGSYLGDLGQLFGLGPSKGKQLKVGSLKIESSGAGVIGDVLFGEPTTMRYGAALPLQTVGFTRAVFSQVANGLGYFTGLAFYNPNLASCKVTLSVYSAAGKLTGRLTKTILPGQRISDLLANLIVSTDGQVGGHILIESTRPIIAQQLFGDSVLNFLSAVPPVVSN